MKKSLLSLTSLLFVSTAFANDDFIRIINHDANNKMVVNYQICTINRATAEPICESQVQAILEKNEIIIPVYNWVFDVVVTKVMKQDAEGKIIAMENFGEEECKAFTRETLLLSQKDSQHIECLKQK